MINTHRLDNCIVFALGIRKDSTVRRDFTFLGTQYDLVADRKHLQAALNISLAQMRNRIYYGIFNRQQIEDAKKRLDLLA